ncbi:hypothetical protein CTA2_10190 [Colletotrichum tanaceti]|uniref:Uncharacterized protein n=1 Tax=Colletotrichum tanaceti TaxID=1306861 RepID=A0A4U6WZG8_9PEZI|nr:hypothetical protein CTA2_10190 [Colletotrichum tanaceti]TKW48532.1 hypothetical protein CTA1_10681 [Colletotrichum tanaceti]
MTPSCPTSDRVSDPVTGLSSGPTSPIGCRLHLRSAGPRPTLTPIEVSVDFNDKIISRILSPLRDDQKHDILWRIRRSLVNPQEGGSVIVLYGRYGHEGKSKLAEMITALIPDPSVRVSKDPFRDKSLWLESDAVMNLLEKRFLICDECNNRDGFSYNNVKRWTSGTPVTLEDGSPDGLLVAERASINNSISRRLVIYYMDKQMLEFEPVHKY